MTTEYLDSDRVNYLIWRYLIESGYRETALHLQKDWNNEDPQQLPFAAHVRNHALVGLLNRGLLYDSSEREARKALHDVAEPQSGFFGPLVSSSLPAPDEAIENVRKRPVDNEQPQHPAGPPGKKPRLSNGYENGFEATPMDLDEDQTADENAYPSPEQLPSPVVVTNGPDQDTQIEKIIDIGHEDTVYLELPGENPAATSIVLQCEFSPRDPRKLAAVGSDALARMWSLSRVNPDSNSDSPENISFSLSEDSATNTTTTGLSWSPDGSYIAIASEPTEEGTAKTEFYDVNDVSVLSTYSGFDSPIICMRWSPGSHACLALSPQDEGKGTLLTVMYIRTGSAARLSLPQHTSPEQYFDATWRSDEDFVLCGGEVLQTFHCNEAAGTINQTDNPFQIAPGDSLSKITFDFHSRLLAMASETGTFIVWDEAGQRRSYNAHQGMITSLIWQPLEASKTLSDNAERLLVSSGEDGAISIWNVRSPDFKAKSSITMGSAVVSLAFSPDGAFIAGATNQRVCIWKPDDAQWPCANWTPKLPGYQTPQSHDSAPEEDQFSLSWDADGRKLAYATSSRVAVINFQP